jgi:hypothetical protein
MTTLEAPGPPGFRGLDDAWKSPSGPLQQAAFFEPSVANGALRTWLDPPP